MRKLENIFGLLVVLTAGIGVATLVWLAFHQQTIRSISLSS